MQLTSDKCHKAPGGNCKDVHYNIKEGARFFSHTLAKKKGNVLEAIGDYNGWFTGMTFAKATAARHSSCCRCQNNLDYLHQYLNGWAQNIDVDTHQPKIGVYFNLDVCPQ